MRLARHRPLALLGLLGAMVALSRWLARARTPDGFDSIDFLLGMSRRFDLATLQPHFPGYPVYVALGAALCRLGVPALAAATAISSLAAGVSALALAVCAERLAGRGAGIPVLCLHGVAWLPWLLGSGALSDSLGLAFAACAFALLALEVPRPGASGVMAGLLLGTRLSYWPLVASLGVLACCGPAPSGRRRLLAGLAAGVLVWAVPFFGWVGVRSFVALGLTHLQGHFGSWGGSAVTRPDLVERARFFARDLFYDGFAPSQVAGMAVVAVAVFTGVLALWTHRPWLRRFKAAPVFVVLAPYALWVFFAQNVAEQPRHLLPLLEGGLLLVGCLLADSRGAIAALCVAALWVNLPLLEERQRLPSSGAQAAAWVAQHHSPETTAIMAGRSWRYFTELPGPYTVRQHTWLSEVWVDLSRFDRLPADILITSEVDAHSGMGAATPLPRAWRIEPGPRFCRDPRIDRSDPCLTLSRLLWAPR